MERFFEIGKIAGTHGIKGTLRVFPTTFDPSRFELLKEITIEHKGARNSFNVTHVGYHKNMVLLTLKEICDINIAEPLKGATILIPESMALPLSEDEYYNRDLYGMSVSTDEGELLGELTDIIETGANDVYEITNSDGNKLLIPAIKQCILKVDINAATMIVKLLKGLRD